MIYLLFTNRPEFAPFANRQMAKFVGCRFVVLTNTECVTGEHYPDAEVIYYDVENNTEMFNRWQGENVGCTEELFISDDDVWYADWVRAFIARHLGYYDRVVLQLCGMFSTVTEEYCVRQWGDISIGTGVAYSAELWTQGKWKRHPDGMVAWHKHFPTHNIKYTCSVGIIHLIHGKNMVLTVQGINPKYFPDAKIPSGFIDEVGLYVTQNNHAHNLAP